MTSVRKHRATTPPGIVVAEGCSVFTNEPLVAVATGLGRPSVNRKTGQLIQVYVLARDTLPSSRASTKDDAAVCGTCKHRPSVLGTCYVDLYRGPNQVWRAFSAGAYPALTHGLEYLLENTVVRISAYGDCAAMPFSAWSPFLAIRQSRGITVLGYTHLWRRCDPRFSAFCMASVETPGERVEARQRGYRTFRIRGKENPLEHGESQCPADSHADTESLCGVARGTVSCLNCRACNGGTQGADITLLPHGLFYRSQRLEAWLASNR